ncbi:hypothetical protein WOLCODRAFT_159493 [Wolfiporia cocos MD-104 SS10]|uniref:Uncharacterized protein n=1 Tax=Wolfiporia cocos (strain MD-104) TaxID=742152 RepID=A0A2H3J2P9_WOLCO|nr:hypothetical protein WOLCODRAFT_159493 [Wolfiporia cocos MD-104 SS10]
MQDEAQAGSRWGTFSISQDRSEQLISEADHATLELGFTEHADGEMFSDSELESVRRACRGFFQSVVERGIVPKSWGRLSTEAASEFRAHLEKLFPELALCENHWKVDQLGTVLYPRWKQKRPQLFAHSGPSATARPVSTQSRPSIHTSAHQEPGAGVLALQEPGERLPAASDRAPRTSIGASTASRESQEASTSVPASRTEIAESLQAQDVPGSSRTSSTRIIELGTASDDPSGDAAPLESSRDISAEPLVPDSAVRTQLTEPNTGDKRPAPSDQDSTGPRERRIRINSAALAFQSDATSLEQDRIAASSLVALSLVASSSADTALENLMPSAESVVRGPSGAGGNLVQVDDERNAAQDTSGDVMMLDISTTLQTEGRPSRGHAGERTARRTTTATERANEAQTAKVPGRQRRGHILRPGNVPNARNIFAHEWKTTHPGGRTDEFDKAFSTLSKEQLQVYTAAANELKASGKRIGQEKAD